MNKWNSPRNYWIKWLRHQETWDVNIWPSCQTCGRYIYVFGWSSTSATKCNLTISTHDGDVNQCNKEVLPLKNIQQINIQKVGVFSYKPKVQRFHFNHKAEMPRQHDDISFINQERFKATLDLIMNWKRRRRKIISAKSTSRRKDVSILIFVLIVYFIFSA